MPRDGSKARARIRQAALDLYGRHGYDRTTAAQIAEHAGVTERTYFRHFADKREVLFDGEPELREILVGAVAEAPEGLAPLQVVTRACLAAVPLLVANRAVAEQRTAIIAATPALQERAYAKTAALTSSLADALAKRGVSTATATLAAQVGMAAFESATAKWDGASGPSLEALIVEAADDVLALGEARSVDQAR